MLRKCYTSNYTVIQTVVVGIECIHKIGYFQSIGSSSSIPYVPVQRFRLYMRSHLYLVKRDGFFSSASVFGVSVVEEGFFKINVSLIPPNTSFFFPQKFNILQTR